MELERFRRVFSLSPLGCAFHRVVFDDQGKPEMFECVEVNPAFAKMFAVSNEKWVGKRWKKNFCSGLDDETDWFQQCVGVALHGEERELQFASDPLKGLFHVEAFPLGERTFLTRVSDISGETVLAQASQKLLNGSLESIGYQFVADQARVLSGAHFALFNLYDPGEAVGKTVAVSAQREVLHRALSQFGFSFVGMKWPFNTVLAQRYGTSSHPTQFPLRDLALGSIPSEKLQLLLSNFDVESVFLCDISCENRILGNFTFLLAKGATLKNATYLEVFAQQVGLLLSREITEERLHESEERWQFALEGSGQGVWDWDIPRESVYFSTRWKQMLGFSGGEISRSFAEWEKRVHPQDAEEFHARMDRHLSGETATFESEHRLQSKNGVFRWFLSKGKAVERDENGKALRVIGTITDITDRKNAERVLRESEEEFRTLAEDMPVFVCKFLPDGTLSYVNAILAKLTPYSAEQLVGMNFYAFLQPEDLPGVRKNLAKISPQNPIAPNVQRLVLPSGEECWQKWINRGFFDSRGKLLYFQSTGQDITQEKKMQQELRQEKENAEAANQAKTQFLMNMSHELRTPLNGLMGFASLLQRTPLSLVQEQYLEYVLASSSALKKVIGDILDFSKIEAGKLELVRESTDLREICERVIQIINLEALDKGVHLALNFDDAIRDRVISHPLRLEQVLLNLVGNGVKFTHNGEVVLRVKLCKMGEAGKTGLIRFQVQDTGIGISPEQTQRIFQAFEQGDSSITRSFGGTGLGLTISMGLLKLMGSSLELQSVPGKGSTFSFQLELPWDRSAIPEKNGTLHFLYLENSPFERKLFTLLVRRSFPQVHVLEAEDPEQARKLVREYAPELVFIPVEEPQVEKHRDFQQLLRPGKESATPMGIVGIIPRGTRPKFNRKVRRSMGVDEVLERPLEVREVEEVIRGWFGTTGKQAGE
ncbi:MAG TPA: PAS domain S-box protein [Thermotogota bacterium]|nr:PAS domain S-box protein [Thermotogota bacterium]